MSDPDEPASDDQLKELATAALRRHRGLDRDNRRPTREQAAAALREYRRANQKGTP